MSLIDFDDSDAQGGGAGNGGAGGTGSGIDELASLFGPAASSAPSNASTNTQANIDSILSVVKGTPTNAPLPSFSSPSGPNNFASNGNGFGGFGANASVNPVFANQMARSAVGGVGGAEGMGTGMIRLGSPAVGTSGMTTTSTSGSSIVGMSSISMGQQQQQQQQRQQQPANAGQAQGKDPFADLVGLF